MIECATAMYHPMTVYPRDGAWISSETYLMFPLGFLEKRGKSAKDYCTQQLVSP